FANLAGTTGAPHDETSRRVTAELVRLGRETSAFMAALALAVALVAGWIGVLCGLLSRWAGRRWPTTACLTAGTLLALVMRAFVRQPALLEPFLGGADGWLAKPLAFLAAHASPRLFDILMMGAVLSLGLLGLKRRRWPRRPVMVVGGMLVAVV